MQLHKDSHLDHGLSQPAIDWLLARFADRSAFFIETVVLPEDLGELECGLYGPLVGDAPVSGPRWDPRADCPFPAPVRMQRRGERAWESRVVGLPKRPTRVVTAIAGPHDGMPCVLYTAYGGPCAPQEPDDPGCRDREASVAFWSQHALAAEAP